MKRPRDGDEDEERQRLLEEGQGGEGSGPGHIYIEDDRGLIEKCLFCLGRSFVVEFDDEDRDVLWHLRRRLVGKARPTDQALQELSVEVWNAAFPEELLTAFEIGKHWQRLGFQGKDPLTDVRTGAWPAEQLASFARHHVAQFRELVKEAGTTGPSEYLFAIVCFNVSHMLAMFFDLVSVPSTSPLPYAHRASRNQLKHLTSLIVSECRANNVQVNADICRRVLDELFVEVMANVHRSWRELTASSPPGTVTIMQFPLALRKGFDANDRFWKRPCKNLSDLRIGQ